MAEIKGTYVERFQGVADALSASLDAGTDVGASVCVIHHGEVVVDIWGGYKEESKTNPWTKDTLVNVWSTTKTMTFLVALMLHDQGIIDINAPVAKYWQEFAQNGKESITVKNVLSHTAGLSGWDVQLRPEDYADWNFCVEHLASQAPWWSDRTQSGYHAISQGYLIGEVVRRATGITIGQYFKKEVADALGADFYIGLPESEESRVSLVIPPKPNPERAAAIMANPTSVVAKTFGNPPWSNAAEMPHNRWWRAAEIPAAGGHGNAKSVATIQSIIANKGDYHGKRFFSEKTNALIFETQARGIDLNLGVESHFGGAGYGLSSSTVPLGPASCYWGGYGGSIITMDQDLGITVSYMMNKMLETIVGDSRGFNIGLAAVTAIFS
jgi:CubicO group peptidase (beta-lactamase class C family)